MPIRILPDELASQIAAGEVVERPASVVKELVENAIDAGATHIQVSIEEAGTKLIEVADNGDGIANDELALAVTRHATSKLHQADELFRIQTLGFRGEALASIGSVSRMTITSRQAGQKEGVQLIVEGGAVKKPARVGAPTGTTVRVENLFYNVPARLKFLKTGTTERRHIDQFVTRYALAYPHARFQLTQEGRAALNTSGNDDPREVLASLYGPDIARQMLTVDTKYENLHIRGFISPTSLTRGSRNAIDFFVNGRWVHDTALTTALVQAYHTLLMVGRFPIGVLFLTLPPDQVDVNVHPAKAEVRFVGKDDIFSGVQRAVRRALLAFTPVPTINTQVQARWTPQAPDTYENAGADNWREIENEELIGSDDDDPEPGSIVNQPVPPIASGMPLLRMVGQVGGAFLVAEGPDGLYLVDQHAAHERVLFEKFMAQRGNMISSQGLLDAVTVELSPDQARLIEDQLTVLNQLGFEIETFGPTSYKVRSIPSVLSGSDPAGALQVLVEDFEEDEAPLQQEIETRIIARVCKRAAVKAGQSLSMEEGRALLHDLEKCQAPRTCPHGRPTMIHLSIDLLERQFGRRGAR